MTELFLAFLAQHDDQAWLRVVDRLAASIHEVDRNATRIWFHFYPLALQRLMARPDADVLARRMALSGRWSLGEQVDDSHAFMYAHRYWPVAKRVVLDYVEGAAAPGSLDLAAQVQEIARLASREAGAPAAVLTGIAAVALRTLQQVGHQRMRATGFANPSAAPPDATPDAVLAERKRLDHQGLFGWLRGPRRQWPIVFDERQADARFPLVDSQHITTAAALDRRDHRARDVRCSEGPIPVQCRSCSCATCWIGVLHGADRLSPMDERERAKLAECGVDVEGSHPIMRLACQAQAFGGVSMVIPPWNGMVRKGK